MAQRFFWCYMFPILVAMVTALEVDVDDLGDDWAYVGDIKPSDPHATVDQVLRMNCSTRRKILRKYNIEPQAMYFKFELHGDATDGTDIDPVVIVPDEMVTVVTPRNPNRKPNMVAMAYPHINISYDQAYAMCMIRINDTHEVEVDGTMLVVGYPPATGWVSRAVTQDLRHLVINYEKSHRNPILTTIFMVTVTVTMTTEGITRDCVSPYGSLVNNDTCEFDLGQFLSSGSTSNVLLAISVTSSNRSGPDKFTNITGPVTEYRLYELYKPTAVQNLSILYNDSQSAIVSWTYHSVPIPLTFYLTYRSHLDKVPLRTQHDIGYFHEGPIQTTLENLRWGVTYHVEIRGKPVSEGYLGDSSNVTFKTAESVPSQNPKISRCGYTREVKANGLQDIIVYWQPVPEEYRYGIITQLRLLIVGDGQKKNDEISDLDARQKVIPGLDTSEEYNIAVIASTRKGPNQTLDDVMTTVPALTNSLMDRIPSNFTVVAENDTAVRLSWKPDLSLRDVNYTMHQCIGKHEYPGKCNPKSALISTVIKNAEPTEFMDYAFVLERHFNLYMFGISLETKYSSSGIHWSSCTYDITKVSPPPLLSRNSDVTIDSVTLFLQKPSCAEERGYIHVYRVVVTKCTNSVQLVCTGEVQKSVWFNDTRQSEYTVDDLKHSTRYMLSVYSVTHKGESSSALEVEAETSARNILMSVVLPVCSVLLVALVITLIVIFSRRFYRKYNKEIPIVTPAIPPVAEVQPMMSDSGANNSKYAEILDPPKQKAEEGFDMATDPEDAPQLPCTDQETRPLIDPSPNLTDLSLRTTETSFSKHLTCDILEDSIDNDEEDEEEVISSPPSDSNNGYLHSGDGMVPRAPEQIDEPAADHTMVMASGNPDDLVMSDDLSLEPLSFEGAPNLENQDNATAEPLTVKPVNPAESITDYSRMSLKVTDAAPNPRLPRKEYTPVVQSAQSPAIVRAHPGMNEDRLTAPCQSSGSSPYAQRDRHVANLQAESPKPPRITDDSPKNLYLGSSGSNSVPLQITSLPSPEVPHSDVAVDDTNLDNLSSSENTPTNSGTAPSRLYMSKRAAQTDDNQPVVAIVNIESDDDYDVDDDCEDDASADELTPMNSSNGPDNELSPYLHGQVLAKTENPSPNLISPRNSAHTDDVSEDESHPPLLGDRADSGVYSAGTSPAIQSSRDSPFRVTMGEGDGPSVCLDNLDEGNSSLIGNEDLWVRRSDSTDTSEDFERNSDSYITNSNVYCSGVSYDKNEPLRGQRLENDPYARGEVVR